MGTSDTFPYRVHDVPVSVVGHDESIGCHTGSRMLVDNVLLFAVIDVSSSARLDAVMK